MTDGERNTGEWKLGEVLKTQREKLGLSLSAVATRSGLGRATVTYYETGHRADNNAPVNPTPKVLRPLAEALELDFDYVLEKAGIQPARRKTDEDAAAEVARRARHLADRIALLDPTFRQAIETIVDRHLRAQGYLAEEADSSAAPKSGPMELRTADPAAGPEELPLGHTSDPTALPK